MSKAPTEKNTRTGYIQRMQSVLEYIENHLGENLSLDQLSQQASFSAFHFHRQFRAFTGMPLYKLIQLLRLRQAAKSLAYHHETSITQIAQECGFENSESFSRAFSKAFLQPPTAFRKNPDWQRWQELFNFPFMPRSKSMDVKIVNFPETMIAALEHHGPEHQIYKTANSFIEWRKANAISPDKGATYGLHYSDPASTLPEDYRQDIAVSVEAPIAENPQGLVNKVIPAGRCALIRHHGSREYIPAADYLYREWLPQSGEELRDFPFFFHYINVGPDVRDRDMITDLYLPIQ
tara:strand:- start:50 stop:925 length:876 start_codon:yes stop_codon:yes gene_type:complete